MVILGDRYNRRGPKLEEYFTVCHLLRSGSEHSHCDAMKLIVVIFTLLVISDCRLKKKVKSKLHPVTMNPIGLEASFGDRYGSHESPKYPSYEREVGIPVGKFYVGLPALLGYLKVLFFLNGRCSSASSCTSTLTTTSTTTTVSTATVTSTSTSISVPLTTSTSITLTTTTTSTTPVTTSTLIGTETSTSTQSLTITSSSTSVISETATDTMTTTSVSVSVTTLTDVVTSTTTTMMNNGRRFGILDYEYDFDSIINDNSLLEGTEASSKSPATFSSMNDDDLLDRENFIDQQDWLNEIAEFNFREIESSKIVEDSTDSGSIINDYPLVEAASSINEDSDLLDRDNFIDQQDWLNEIAEFNVREIESSKIANFHEIQSEY